MKSSALLLCSLLFCSLIICAKANANGTKTAGLDRNRRVLLRRQAGEHHIHSHHKRTTHEVDSSNNQTNEQIQAQQDETNWSPHIENEQSPSENQALSTSWKPSETSGNTQQSSQDSDMQKYEQSGTEGEWSYVPRDPFTWDGESSWDWEYPRTLYFEPTAGLGNRLRALASAVVMAKEYGVGLKVIWREEEGCKDCGNPGFNSSWGDLFSEPNLRLADNFPGSTYDAMNELAYLGTERHDDVPKLTSEQCEIHYPRSHDEMKKALSNGWAKLSSGEEVLCVKSDLWLTEAGEKEGKFFFRLLKPSAMVQAMMDNFKYTTEWEENHMVGVHVRRGDLTIYGKNNKHSKVKGLIPIESYIETMKKQKELATGVKRVRFFLATDDAEAEAQIKAAFKPGYVVTYPKHERSRLAVRGIQEALVDVMLLADCPVLIGTYYSSYSETAKMMGWPFYIQVGHALKSLSVETKFAKDDPDEEEERRRRKLMALVDSIKIDPIPGK